MNTAHNSSYFRLAWKSLSLTCLKSRTSLSVFGLDLRPLSGDTAEEPWRYKRNDAGKKTHA